MIDHMIHSNSPGRELIRINIKLPDCVLRHKIKKLLGFSTEQFFRITTKSCKNKQYRSVRWKTMLPRHLFMNWTSSHESCMMEDGGITHSPFSYLEKMLFAVIMIYGRSDWWKTLRNGFRLFFSAINKILTGSYCIIFTRECNETSIAGGARKHSLAWSLTRFCKILQIW